MKRIINFIKDYTFGFILSILVFGVVGVYAATSIQASKLSVDTTNIEGIGSNKTVQDSIEYLYNKGYCPSKYKCYKLHTTPQVGDYVKMTPTSTSYTADTTKTGYTSNQIINPSELNLWRVIKVNSDGTIEMVSEHVSSKVIYFKGQTGYKNFVGYLNVLANQYQNTKYTIKARHMGYNGQTEYLTDTANTVDSTSTTAPWTSSTGSSTIESQGGGDTLYTTDTDLVKAATGTLVATNTSGASQAYWLASRYYYYYSSTAWRYSGRYIIGSGVSSYELYVFNNGFGLSNYTLNSHLRPIVTLKSGISYTPAPGTSGDPFVLE